MNEEYKNKNISEKEQNKTKIRERYKGLDMCKVEVIPAHKSMDFYDDVERRVAVYVRVSTGNIQQTSSYELQKNYYEDMVNRNPNWTVAGIYADEGISGTSLKHRDEFNRMIADCRAGKIDMIITKSVSRFSRNIKDCITTIEELHSLKNPVGVYFETEGIFSLNDEREANLHMVLSMAQEESHIKSSSMNNSIEMRFSHGILLTPALLGYDRDENGKLIINEDEAKTVRLIFFMYLYGCSCSEIADVLMRLGRKTKKGNIKWTENSVINVLRNERHCGDVLARKTYTPRYLDHKSRKNRGDKNQYRWKDTHDAIISRSDFIAVQHLIDNAKYGNKNILPQLKVISGGALNGFVSINLRWAAFTPKDYFEISESVYKKEAPDEALRIEAREGDIDYRGYEIAGSQFFNTVHNTAVFFSIAKLGFSSDYIRKLGNSQFVEVFIHPVKKLIAVRACASGSKNAVKWTTRSSTGCRPQYICGKAFLKTVYEIFGWRKEFKYRVYGSKKCLGNNFVLLFNASDSATVIHENKNIDSEKKSKDPDDLFPSGRSNNFGSDFYLSVIENMNFGCNLGLETIEKTLDLSEISGLDITNRENTEKNIQYIIKNIKETPKDE